MPKPNKSKFFIQAHEIITSTMQNMRKKIVLKRIESILKSHKFIPNTQFGFRANFSSFHQIYRISIIVFSFENKNYYPSFFLEVSQIVYLT